jgi:nucleoside-triphosphatase THEP1
MSKRRKGAVGDFTEAFHALGLLKELGEKKEVYDLYYVPRHDRRIGLLKERLMVDRSPSKVLYSGHRKSGKTTELYRLIYELQDNYFTIYYSVLDKLEIGDINYIDILLTSTLELYDAAINEGLSIDEELISDVADWLTQATTEVIRTKVEAKTKGWDIGAKLRYLIAELGAGLRSDEVSRNETRQRLTPRTSEVIERGDQIAEAIRQQSKKEPLVIIDDLDKLDLKLATEIFSAHTRSLLRPNFKVIYTVPISLVLSPEVRQIEAQFGQPSQVLSMIKTKEKDGDPYQLGLDFLKGIISKRINEELFEPEALKHLLNISDGVLSDLLSVAQTCCIKAIAEKSPKITWDMVDEEYELLTNSYRRMTPEEYYPKLAEIHKNKTTENDEKLRDLLHWLAALEYDQGAWYDVHPAIVPLLKQKGLA